ncbi:MAG: hypothetical protein KME23_21450 [Goleter apudmare HA4340-LM2]|jgi:hypothetical protein|nr:hypothetical protein [Goleter apudmare HA4340-LM2]
MPKTYIDPENAGEFLTEDDDGTVRESTPEEAEEVIEQWNQWDKEGTDNGKDS